MAAENVCIIRPEDCEIAAMLMSSTEICYITKTRMVKFAYNGWEEKIDDQQGDATILNGDYRGSAGVRHTHTHRYVMGKA